MPECTCHDVLIVKNLNRWFKEKWVDVSRKDPKTGKHPPCGRSKAKKGSKGYPKCRPSVRVSSKTPKTSGEMTSGQKRAATKRKRSKKQGVGGKPTIVKEEQEHHSSWGQPTSKINLRTKVKQPTARLRTANYDGANNTIIADGDETATLRRRNDGWEMSSSKETNVPEPEISSKCFCGRYGR